MNARAVRPPFEFEVVGVAVGTAVVSGALALLGPYLSALTEALAALAFAGWVAARRRSARLGWARLDRRSGLALAALGVGTIVFFTAPTPLAPARALVLALALVPLWWTAPPRGP